MAISDDILRLQCKEPEFLFEMARVSGARVNDRQRSSRQGSDVESDVELPPDLQPEQGPHPSQDLRAELMNSFVAAGLVSTPNHDEECGFSTGSKVPTSQPMSVAKLARYFTNSKATRHRSMEPAETTHDFAKKDLSVPASEVTAAARTLGLNLATTPLQDMVQQDGASDDASSDQGSDEQQRGRKRSTIKTLMRSHSAPGSTMKALSSKFKSRLKGLQTTAKQKVRLRRKVRLNWTCVGVITH